MSIAMAQPTETISSLTLRSTSPAAAHAHQAMHVSGDAIVIAVVAALLALGCLIWALSRLLDFEPRWVLSLRHAMAEAGLRTSATWAELSDWIRLGH